MSSYPKVLIIGYVWPETNASAAGVRDWAFMEQFRAAGWTVHYASPAKPNSFSEKLDSLGVPSFSCEANDPRFDAYIREIRPDVVIFDRFVIEEQFGWRVEEHCPEAIRVLDTQDLHCLRRAREAAGSASSSLQDSERMIEEFAKEDLLRELSSIYRSDLTLVISSFELKLLTECFGIPSELLSLLRFSYTPRKIESLPVFGERSNFVSIGNFRHPPNADAVRWLAREIWPLIRKRMPDTQVHVFGAYPSREMMALSDADSGFIVKGQAEDQYMTLMQYRVLLAPLRFGAGIKGKISDSWSVGTPVLTTPIGEEGMQGPAEIAQSAEAFARKACELYHYKERWEELQAAGISAIEQHYNGESNSQVLMTAISELRIGLDSRRARNRIGAMLRLNLHRSTKYFSKWIELKTARSLLR